MEDVFSKLQADGKNNVDTLMSWMKDSKVIEDNQAAREKALGMFADAADKNNIQFEKFQEVVGKLAAEQKKSIGDFAQLLSDKGPEMLKNALAAAAGAFSGALGK